MRAMDDARRKRRRRRCAVPPPFFEGPGPACEQASGVNAVSWAICSPRRRWADASTQRMGQLIRHFASRLDQSAQLARCRSCSSLRIPVLASCGMLSRGDNRVESSGLLGASERMTDERETSDLATVENEMRVRPGLLIVR